jgi:ACS family glucarate transporter-like MFS transporter
MFMGTSLASAVTAPLVSWLMLSFGWQASFYVTALPALVIGILWLWLARDYPNRTALSSNNTINVLNATRDDIVEHPVVHIGDLLRNRNVLLLIVTYVSEGYVLFLFVFWLYIYLVEKRGFTMLSGGWIAAIPWITSMVLTPFGGLVCDRIARRKGHLQGAKVVIISGYSLSGPLLFLAAYSSARWTAVAALALSIACLMGAESSFWSSATHMAGKHVGLLSGIMNTAGILGGIASTSLLPLIVQTYGWLTALSSGTVMALICALLWAGVHEPPDRVLKNAAQSSTDGAN